MPSPSATLAAATSGVYDSIINEFESQGCAIVKRTVQIDSVRAAVVAQFLADGWFSENDVNNTQVIVIYPDVAPNLWDTGDWDSANWSNTGNPGEGI